MKCATSTRHRALILVVAAALLLWGVLGVIDRRDAGWGGYVYSPDGYIVEGVEPDGAAEAAGLREGDRVVSVAGIPVEELPLYSRWPRDIAPRGGETLRLEVEREGEQLAVDVVYATRGLNQLALGAGLIGLSFTLFGLWAMLTVNSIHATRLAHLGLAAGVALIGAGGPYLGTFDGVATHIQFASELLWSILMLRFFLLFPTVQKLGDSRIVTGILYATLIAFVACLVLELIFHPVLYHTFGVWGALLMLLYCLLAFVAAIWSLIRTPRRQWRDSGLSWIGLGLLVAFVPTAVGAIDWALIWQFDLPGSSYYPLMLATLPLAMALAVRRRATSIS